MDYYALPLLTVWILSAIGFSLCQNEPPLDGPLDGAVGGSVVFKLTNPPSEPPTTIIWTFKKDGKENGIFGSVGGGVPDINAEYENRISVNSSTASLELRNLTLNDTGEYNLKLSITGGGVTTSLTVFERITNVQAEASQTDLVEFNSSVILTCSASGSTPSFRWFNNSADVTGSDRVLLDNNTLTVLNVTRYDKGPYQCNASNIISAEISPPPGVILTIAYGPDSSVVTVTPEGPYISGSNITLSCSSESSPAAQLQWALNGTLLGNKGPELVLENVLANQSGAYSCWAYNNKTQRYKISAPTSITVLERITNVQAEASLTDPVEFNSSVILTCSASGTSPSFRWLNNSAEVTGSDRVLLGNNTLTLLNVTRSDKGPYQCNASNIFSAEISPPPGVILTIAYGPDSSLVTVTPEGPYISGSNITLSCSSESSPAAQLQWALNGTLLGNKGPELRLENIQTGQSGAYSCWAYNSKTQRYKISAPTNITVLERITNVQAEASQTDLVEFNSSVILTCSASGSSPSFRWLNNSAEVTGSDRVLLDKNNLTVLNVTRYDIGPYQCNASNIISAETSPSPGVTLTIAYGPDSPVVTVKPEGPYISGSNITLSCFSKSSPAAQFQWALNGTLLGKEPELRLENIQTGQSGDYSCQAYNSKTQRYKTSAPTSIIVQEKGLGGGSHVRFPAWAIAVIVIVVLGIPATIGISFYVVKKKKNKGPSGNQQASDQNNGSVELNYADITQFQKRNGQRQDLGNHRDEGTEYAAVKLPGYTRPYQPGQSQVGHVNSQNTPRAGPPAYGSRGQAPASPNQIPDVTYAQVMRR